MKKSKGAFLIFFVVIVVAVFLLGSRSFFSRGGGNIAGGDIPCINPVLPVPNELHIHPELEIYVDGKNVPVPANIGLEFTGCERVLHTHDETGKLHIEPNQPITLTLGDFFKLWGKPFSSTELLDCKSDAAVDGSREVRMTVDGSPSDQFEKLVLKDKQKIKIECGVFNGAPKP